MDYYRDILSKFSKFIGVRGYPYPPQKWFYCRYGWTRILPSGLATKRALIGGHKVSSGKWSWSDGTKWDFESWADGQPSDENGEEEEYYLELISPEDGQWNDVPLEYSNEHGYICQYKL